LTLDILLKKLVRGPPSRSSRALVLLLVNLPLAERSRRMKAMVIKPVFVVVMVVVGTPLAMRTTPIMTEIGVVLRNGKVSIRYWQ